VIAQLAQATETLKEAGYLAYRVLCLKHGFRVKKRNSVGDLIFLCGCIREARRQ